MDAHAILASLIYNQNSPQSGEGLARLVGIVHLYHASGIHLLAFFGFVTWVCEVVSKRMGFSVRSTKAIGLILCLGAFFWVWHLQSFRPSFLRPMATFLVRLFFRKRGAILKLAVPLLFTFLIEWASTGSPWKNPGASHYYLAVAGGLFAWDGLKNRPLWFKHFGLSLGSWLPIAMLDLGRDHLVSYLTPFFSYLSLPFISLCLYPLSLFSLLFQTSIPQFLIKAWQWYLDALLWVTDTGLSFAVVPGPAVWGGLVLAVLFKFSTGTKRPQSFFILTLLIAMSLRIVLDFFPANRVVQIDVGQGDAALMQQNNKNEMIDVGSERAKSTEAWIRELARLNVVQLDAILLTHLDEDHVGALRSLLPAVPIGCVETHADLQRTVKGQRLKSLLLRQVPGPSLVGRGCLRLARVEWFQSKQSGLGGNELMAGTVHPLNQNTAYFALGDGDVEQELEYSQAFAGDIARFPHRIWKVSHHGSRFSSGLSFLNKMNADVFWISSGAHNRYHHPHPSTLLKLSQLKARVYRTDREGDLYWTE